MSKDKEFLAKLKALLEEYSADISWSCGFGSDTHGIYDECMNIAVDGKDILTVEYKSYITSHDIKI